VADLTPSPDLLRSLGRLARGLSCVFWGLPITLLASVPDVQTQWLGNVGWLARLLAPVAATGMMLFGIWELGAFQPQERVWQAARSRAQVVALLNFGLSPFLYWASQAPSVQYFAYAALLLHLCELLLLATLNSLLERLGAMLPDATLRAETRLFATVNRVILMLLLFGMVIFQISLRIPTIEQLLGRHWEVVAHSPNSLAFVLGPVLVVLALTMAVTWKIKEVILQSVFGGQH
jgi:hypothetical protein